MFGEKSYEIKRIYSLYFVKDEYIFYKNNFFEIGKSTSLTASFIKNELPIIRNKLPEIFNNTINSDKSIKLQFSYFILYLIIKKEINFGEKYLSLSYEFSKKINPVFRYMYVYKYFLKADLISPNSFMKIRDTSKVRMFQEKILLGHSMFSKEIRESVYEEILADRTAPLNDLSEDIKLIEIIRELFSEIEKTFFK